MSDINEIELPSFPWVWHPQGDANEYCLLTSDNRWVVAFRCNGELMTAKQEAIIRHMVAAANAAEGVSITALETVGKSLFDGDIATLEQENRQMRTRMERLERENAAMTAAIKLCIPELRGWMNSHGEDIGTIEAIKAATEAIAA